MQKTALRKHKTSGTAKRTSGKAAGFFAPQHLSPDSTTEGSETVNKRVHPEDAISNVTKTQSTFLPTSTEQFFSARLGYDFSQVRIHTGPEADASAKNLNAKAYTVGKHIVFSHGLYAPETQEGKALLAHELTHIIQQQQNGPMLQMQRRAPRSGERRGPDLPTTRQALLDALMTPDSPLWRQLNPHEDSPVNCPATAEAVQHYLATGTIRPAPGGDDFSSFGFSLAGRAGPLTRMNDLTSLLSQPNSFIVVQANRSPEYLRTHEGITPSHFFTMVNYRGAIRIIDAYGRGQVYSNPSAFARSEGFNQYYYWPGNFHINVHNNLDSEPDLGD